MADHFRGHFDTVEIFELIMNIPGGHPSSIEGNDLFFNTGNIPLVLGNEPGFKLTVSVPWDVNLEITKLAFKRLFRMPIPLIGDTVDVVFCNNLSNMFLCTGIKILLFDKNCHILILTKKELISTLDT